MLHILWLIIKFILILLGILLGIVVLLLLALLFVPVRYRLEGSREDQVLRGAGRVSWLFGGISFRVFYDGKQFTKDMRIFGCSLLRLKAWRDRRRRARAGRTKQKKKRPEPGRQTSLEQKTAGPDRLEQSGRPAELRQKTEGLDSTGQTTGRLDGTARQTGRESEKAEESREQEAGREELLQSGPESKKAGFSAYFRSGWQMLTAILKRLAGIPGKLLQMGRRLFSLPGRILNAIGKIALTIRKFCDRISYWKKFLQDERTKGAIRHIWQECRGLLKQMSPRKISGQVIFGAEDPAVTGEILAGLGMTFPIHRNRVQVVPVFDRKILEGEIQCRGRIYGITLLRIAWRLYFDQNIRYVWKRWNNKEG